MRLDRVSRKSFVNSLKQISKFVNKLNRDRVLNSAGILIVDKPDMADDAEESHWVDVYLKKRGKRTVHVTLQFCTNRDLIGVTLGNEISEPVRGNAFNLGSQYKFGLSDWNSAVSCTVRLLLDFN